MTIIPTSKSIVPACDVDTLEKLDALVSQTCGVEGIGAYKIGFELVIAFGMPKVIATIRKHTTLPIIYDHQKAGTDVPFTGEKFVKACKTAGCDAVILFPQAGPETAKAWIEACQKIDMGVIIGGEMTHVGYLASDGGYILVVAPDRIYELAADLGVTEFVVPGNKPERIEHYRKLLTAKGLDPVFHSPGLVTQGGSITESAKAAGKSWHAIVGRAIYEAADMQNAAEKLVFALK